MCKKVMYSMLVIVLVLLADMANADITTGLVGYWKLDGNANDSSGNNYHGEEYGSPSYVPGMIGQAMEFNGSDQSVYIPDFTVIQNQDEVTVCMWVKADRNTGEDQVMWFTDEDGSYGRVRFGINGDEWEWKHGGDGGNPNVDDGDNPIILSEWTHLAGVRKNNDRLELFVNGISVEQTAFGVAGVAEPQASIGSERRSSSSVRSPFDGAIDEVRLYIRALSAADIQELFMFAGALPAVASNPDPDDGQTDVPRDVVLSWTPGEYASAINGHTVYFSESFNDGIGGVTQDASSYARPQLLDFDTTYYWRVDEVNAPPDSTVFKGNVWSFTTELVGHAIDNVTATASSQDNSNVGPENTFNGSGLDESGLLHDNQTENMWLSNLNGVQPTWIQFEFDKPYKLHEMLVWNSNTDLETSVGFGIKDVSIEYSADGVEYATLGTTHEFAQATSDPGYEHNTTVDFGGVVAKSVRLTINSNWGGFLPQYGLSEVRFFRIPLRAREPSPASGATDIDPDVVLGWRAGREAAEHDVYLSIDEQAVTDGTAPVETMTETSYGPLSLDLGATYYWKVNEVNMTETPSMLPADIWSFTVADFIVIDDFEGYDAGENQIWYAWRDGLGFGTPGTEPYYAGNGTGSAVGDDTTYSYTEETIVHGGVKSMPFFYDNSILRYSEAEMTLTSFQDWTKYGIKVLSLWFRGISDNAAEPMYVVLNGSAVVTHDNPNAVQLDQWTEWTIDLQRFADQGVNLANVNTIAIGLGNKKNPVAGGSGTIYIDDIQLRRLLQEPEQEPGP